ncbi:hypothetical protein HDU87_000557 [Geranomyces variabilis]|uniref:EGF-like domain-containing protein n=1 Tax=Geranomyces variabilis TaxID=109894 RepID=A0AAD5TDC2_9FUNG|nr:hypothetical protein HDU87_000557 [Geranomyces variabilis]
MASTLAAAAEEAGGRRRQLSSFASLLLVAALASWVIVPAAAVHFTLNQTYLYEVSTSVESLSDLSQVIVGQGAKQTYSGQTQSVGNFYLDARFNVIPYDVDTSGRTYCQISFPVQPTIVSETTTAEGGLRRVVVPPDVLNFNEYWFGFLLSPEGDVAGILNDPREHAKVLEVKKGIVNIFSAKIHDSGGIRKRDFEISETDLSGEHNAAYTVDLQPDNGRVIFKKRAIRGEEGNNMQLQSDKEIVKDHTDGHILSVTVDDYMSSHGTVGTATRGLAKRDESDEDDSVPRPTPQAFMQTTGKTTVRLLKKRSVSVALPIPPSTLEQTSLLLHAEATASPPPITPQEALKIVRKGLACFDGSIINSVTTPSHAKKAKCFGAARVAMNRLPADAQATIMERVLREHVTEKNGHAAVDLAGEVCKQQPWVADALFGSVFRTTRGGRPVGSLVKESALQAITKCSAHSATVVDGVSEIAFNATFGGAAISSRVSLQALLSVGHIARKASDNGDDVTSKEIASRLSAVLAQQDTAVYKSLRGTKLTGKAAEPFARSAIVAAHKAAHHATILAALGATRRADALPSIASATDLDSTLPEVIQMTAARALGSYRSQKSENLMLMIAGLHPYAQVRRSAAGAYMARKRDFSIENVAAGVEELRGHSDWNQTAGLSRAALRARDLVSFVQTSSSVSFHLQTPSFSWNQKFGADIVGVRAAVNFDNSVDLFLSVLRSQLTISVSDSAGAFLYVDIGGYQELSIFDAELQFYAQVGYDMDMLNGFKLSDITNIGNLFDQYANEAKNEFEMVRTGVMTAFNDMNTAFTNVKALVDGTSSSNFSLPNFSFNVDFTIIPDIVSLDDADEFNSFLQFFATIEQAVLDFANDFKTTVHTGIDPIFQELPQSLADIFAGITQFINCPQQAVDAIVVGVQGVQDTISSIELAVGQMKLLFSKAALESRLPNIEDEFFDDVEALATMYSTELQFIPPLLDLYTTVVSTITQVSADFLAAYTTFKTWMTELHAAYDKVKSFIDSIFGAKFAKSFPNTPAADAGGNALVFPTNMYEGIYNGSSISASPGSSIVVPLAGVASQVSSNVVQISVTENSLKGYSVFLGNVLLANSSVAGPILPKGSAFASVTLGSTFVHVSIQNQKTLQFIDPTKYFPRRLPGLLGDGFNPNPNYYSLTVVGQQLVPPTPVINLSSLKKTTPSTTTTSVSRRAYRFGDEPWDTAPRSLAKRDLLSDLGLPGFSVSIPDVCNDPEFQNAQEICGGGMLPEFSKSILLYKTTEFFLVAGFVPVTFSLEFDAVMGIQSGVSVCLLGLTVEPTVTPEFGVAMTGTLSVGAFLEISLLAKGTVADTHVPINVHFPLTTFPVGTCIDVTANILPLQLEIDIGVTIDFFLFSKSWYVTIVSIALDQISVSIASTCPVPGSNQLPPKDSGTLVDQTPPAINSLVVSQVANLQPFAPLLFAKFDIADPESGILNASISVGWNPGDSSLIAPSVILRDQGSSLTLPGLSDQTLLNEKQIFVTLVVYNQQNMKSQLSKQILWDLSAPVISITEAYTPISQYKFTSIGQSQSRVSLRKAMQSFTYDLSQQIGGAACQGFTDSLGFSYAVTDATAQASLEYAIGTGSEPNVIGTIVQWTPITASQTSGAVNVGNLTLVHGVTYHFAVRATNALGFQTVALSKGSLIDVTPPTLGTIFMGPTLRQDWNATSVTVNAIFNFNGFDDVETDIAYFNFAIGPSTMDPSVIPTQLSSWAPFSGWTPPVFNTGSGSSDVNAEIPHLSLPEGNHTLCVQANNWAGLISLGCRRGYIVDTTPPRGSVWLQHGSNPASPGDVVVSFAFTDPNSYGSGVQYVKVGLGDGFVPVYTGFTTIEVPSNPGVTNYTFTVDQSLNGVLLYGQLQLIDYAGNQLFNSSNQPIKVDFFPPTSGMVYDGWTLWAEMAYIDNNKNLSCSWTPFSDLVNGLNRTEVSFGTSAGATDVINWTQVPLSAYEVTLSVQNPGLIPHGSLAFCNVRAWNNNGDASQATVASAAGTYVDLTAPQFKNARILTGGLPAYQFQTTYISVSWDAAYDPESDIAMYTVTVTDSSTGLMLYPETIVDQTFPTRKSTVLYGVAVIQGSRFYATIAAYNGATNVTSVQTQVVTIDETPPILLRLSYNNLTAAGLAVYASSLSNLYSDWTWSDPESGIDPTTLQCILYEEVNGEPVQVTGVNATATLSGCGIIASPSLLEGVTYVVSATAGNGAGLVTSSSLSLKIVVSPPVFISAGSGSAIIDQPTLPVSTDNAFLRGWFRFQDANAPIVQYQVGFGTQPGLVDLTGFVTTTQAYIVVPFNLTINGTYFMAVSAVNAAGIQSAVHNLTVGTTTLAGPKPGFVSIGPDPSMSADYQQQDDVLVATFSNFTHPLPGAYYEWALGTSPAGTDVVPYTVNGLLIPSQAQQYGQIIYPLTLKPNVLYYVSVRALFGLFQATDTVAATSRPFEVLQGPLPAPIIIYGLPFITGGASAAAVAIACSVDSGSPGLAISSLAISCGTISTYPQYTDFGVQTIQMAGSPTSTKASVSFNFTGVDEGDAVYCSCTAYEKNVKLSSTTSSDAIIVDSTPPLAPADFSCSPKIIATGGVITCEWGNFVDPESGISNLAIMLGSSSGGSEIAPQINITGSTFVFDTSKYLAFSTGVRYFITVRATNNVGLQSAITTFADVDSTPPVGQASKLYIATQFGGVYYNSSTRTVAPLSLHRTDCLRETSTINVVWDSAFSDLESGMLSYRVAVREQQLANPLAPGAVLLDWTSVGNVTATALNLTTSAMQGTQISVILEGTNVAGLKSVLTSEPVGVVAHGPVPVYVRQLLSNKNSATSFSLDQNTISAEWAFQHYCPITRYMWSISDNTTGQVVQPAAITTLTQVTASNLVLSPNRSYVVTVQAWDSLNTPGSSAVSDGVTIIFKPPTPGRVYDGPYLGIDIDEIDDANSLSASWDDMSTPSCAILSYTVSFGSNYLAAPADVLLPTAVGLNRTARFSLDSPLPSYLTIYTTVAALTCQGLTISSISNGFSVGQRPPPTQGAVWIDNGLNTVNATAQMWQDRVTIHWAGITSTWSALQFQVALGIQSSMAAGSLFVPLTALNSTVSTFTFSNLALNASVGSANWTYYAFVVATDASQQSASSAASFIVDMTTPQPGTVQINAFKATGISNSSAPLWLSEISGLSFSVNNASAATGLFDLQYAIVQVPPSTAGSISGVSRRSDQTELQAVLQAMNSTPGTVLQPFQSVGSVDLTGNTVVITAATNFATNATYAVVVRAIAWAGSDSFAMSSPLQIDQTKPNAGSVNLGTDITVDRLFTPSNTTSQLTWLEAVDKTGVQCPQLTQNLTTGGLPSWLSYQTGLGDFNITNTTVLFRSNCANITAQGLLLQGSWLKGAQQFSGCEVKSSIHATGSSFTFRMKPSASPGVVSTFILSDTDDTVLERNYLTTSFQPLPNAFPYAALGVAVMADAPGVLVVWTSQQGDKAWRGQVARLAQNATGQFLTYTIKVGKDASRIVVTDDLQNSVGSATFPGLSSGSSAFRTLAKLAPRFRLWATNGTNGTNSTTLSTANMTVSSLTYPLNTTYGCNYADTWNDLESGIDHYEIAIGTALAQTDVAPFQAINASSIQPRPSTPYSQLVTLRANELERLGVINQLLQSTTNTTEWCSLNVTQGGCSPLAACALAPLPTNSSTTTSSSSLAFTCTCAPGYQGTGYGYNGCVDIDECAVARGSNSSLCGPNASCLNLPGTYACACNTGYQGNDAYVAGCVDIDECALAAGNRTAICGPGGCCQNVPGSYKCVCYNGFTAATPQSCVDVNECAGRNNCSSIATCRNTVGGYKCACPSGTQGQGFGTLGCQPPDPNAGCGGAASLFENTNTTGMIKSSSMRTDPLSFFPTATMGVWYKVAGTGDLWKVTTQHTPPARTVDTFQIASFSSCFMDVTAIATCYSSGQCTLQFPTTIGQPAYLLVLDSVAVNFTIVATRPIRAPAANASLPYTMLPAMTQSGYRCLVASSQNVSSPIPGLAPGQTYSAAQYQFNGCLKSPAPWVNSGALLRTVVENAQLYSNVDIAACANTCYNGSFPLFSYSSPVSASAPATSACVCMPIMPPGTLATSNTSCLSIINGKNVYSMASTLPIFQLPTPPMWCPIPQTCPATASSNPPTAAFDFVRPRNTTSGISCVMPFYYNSTLYTDCVTDFGGTVPWCFVDKSLQTKATCSGVDWCSAQVAVPVNGTCLSGNGTTPSYQISCTSGYAYNATTNSCSDLDECALGTDTCEPLATCVNQPGGYQCICNASAGYTMINNRCFYIPSVFNLTGAAPGSVTPPPSFSPAKYFLALKAVNLAGLESTAWSNQMTIDAEPPTVQSIQFTRNGDNVTVISSTNISATWAFSDLVSGIQYYDFALSAIAPYRSEMYQWTRTNATSVNVTAATLPSDGGMVYLTVNATDGALNVASAWTSVMVQTHPPNNTAAFVRLTDFGRSVVWGGFVEPFTSIAYTELSIGSTNMGIADIMPWTVVSYGSSAPSAVIYGVNASYFVQQNTRTILSPVWFSIRATNLGGLGSIVSVNHTSYWLGPDAAILGAASSNNSATITGFQDISVVLKIGATMTSNNTNNGILVVPMPPDGTSAIPHYSGLQAVPPPILVIRAGGKYAFYQSAVVAILSSSPDGTMSCSASLGAAVNGSFASPTYVTQSPITIATVWGANCTGGGWAPINSTYKPAQGAVTFMAPRPGSYAIYANSTPPTFSDFDLDGIADVFWTQDSTTVRLRRQEQEQGDAAIPEEEQNSQDQAPSGFESRVKRATIPAVKTQYGYWPSSSLNQNVSLQWAPLTSTMTIMALTDMDMDSVTDLVVWNTASNSYHTILLRANGTLKADQVLYCPNYGTSLIGLADVDLSDNLASFWYSGGRCWICMGTNTTLPCKEQLMFSASGLPVGLGTWGTSRIGMMYFGSIHNGISFGIQSITVSLVGATHQVTTTTAPLGATLATIPGQQQWIAYVAGDLNGDGISDLLLECTSTSSKCGPMNNSQKFLLVWYISANGTVTAKPFPRNLAPGQNLGLGVRVL